ncbi:malonyl-[acyl-carrier protein] O-methyltransferase-like isoform X1 [Mercenaria mercenaria]|uniref:malonyl-[acyl-carrier protein] O-methyltransferase-like isoform X1 n=1 Tax=Mercenaria mercenaria TaxID=6596 RepID=UPI00234E3902|nr:malonyl-[acyl-carrier protein] O-methyltransferase-like isoform X1 [Mercenaria mercenaria]
MSNFVNYNRASRSYDNQRFPAGSDTMAAMIQFYTSKNLPDLRILDAGCGTGNYSKSLLDIGVGQMALLDSSSEMLKTAKDKLDNYIECGKVTDVVECTMPPIPFPDDSFDAVLFNTVLNHLDRANSAFPNCVETLNESRRILRPNGVIIVSTALPSAILNAVWFTKINTKLTKRFIENAVPSLDQFEKMFIASGIECFQKMNILGSDIFKNYYNVDGLPEESWLKENEYLTFATESEAGELFRKVKELKENGELENWVKENDHTQTIGVLTIFVCKPVSAK